MKRIIQKKLKFFARAILHKYQPEVIGITGSVGKTSCKEAVYTVLSGSFNIRKNIKNYNNELGVPLTIIGATSGGHSLWQWFKIFARPGGYY
jgi:UDP-N-acetylmuramoyl-tripeptide--D-alanyl-D-alanine ligase